MRLVRLVRLVVALFAAFLQLALFAALALPAAAARTETVPVVVCPTTDGVNDPPKPVPASVRVPERAAHLEVYSTTSGYFQILGPQGMACQGTIGADATTTITVARPGPAFALAGGGVAAVAYPTCALCQLELACPFFPAALTALHREYAGTACASRPPGLTVHRLSSETLRFFAPAGEHIRPNTSGLVPSGSPYSTYGVVVYATYRFRGTRETTTMEAVCVLPETKHPVCSELLDEFLATQVKKFT